MRSNGLRAGTATCAIAVACFVLVLGLPFAGVGAQGVVDTDADRILRSMSSYLGHLVAFSADYDVDTEVIDQNGQKLDFSASGSLVVERPSKVYGTRKGGFVDAEFYFDGKTVTLYGKRLNAYLQIGRVGTIDEAIDAVRTDLGLDLAAADLLYADPYPGLLTDVSRGVDLGTEVDNGIACEHLAFRAAKVDWQIWVQSGARPLPMKYVITSKWVAGAPQYAVRFRNWNVNPLVDRQRFTFTPPQGSKKIDTFVTNVIGEIREGQR